MQAAKRSLCVIGAGPSGMSVLYHLEKLRLQGGSAVGEMPQVACFEKQNDWSGLWNYTWRTGAAIQPQVFQPLQALTKYGETVHGSMYRSLWSNNPKETIEYPDYTFEQHFGRRWNQYNLKPKVTLLHSVQSVTFDPAKEKFSVLVKDLEQNRVLDPKEFDYVVNCSGHFSNPNVPYFKGIERFPGRVVHTHDLRSWREFAGKRVLVVGSSYSAEDSVLQSVKFGASRVISSYRTNPLGFRWPESVSERPLVTEVGPSDGGGTEGWARFADGSVEKNQFYSFPMFDAQALWTVRYLTGGIQLPSSAEMDADTKPWLEREAALKSHQEAVDLQTDYTVGLAKQANYGFDLDASQLFYKWFDSRDEDITTYRDGQYKLKMTNKRVCLIGAGPSGMSVLYHLERLRLEGAIAPENLPEVTCYEKQDDCGGLWNYTWRTGTDEYGENVHGSMYRSLWSNGPKEALEYPDYTFEQHFGGPIPSFPPREALRDYLWGRWNKYNLKPMVTLLHSVQSVNFDPAKDKFTVVVKDLKQNKLLDTKDFDFVVNCSGHFSTPNVPYFKGIERFPGRVMHTHDLRSWREFSGKRVLVVGASYSAEDSALQSIKFGATSVVCSYRSKPMDFRWPDSVSERPLVTEVGGDDRVGAGGWARFSDGSMEQIDYIILATGYLHHYPYLAEQLRLRGPNLLYPAGLYKGTVWLAGGNNRLLYLGAQDQYYTYTMFDAQALWTVRYLTGAIQLPSSAEMAADAKAWVNRAALSKTDQENIAFQTDFVVDLANQSNYGYDLDVSKIFYEWEDHRAEDITTYKDRQFVSKFSGQQAPPPGQPFMKAIDDSLEHFLASCQGK
uniref:Flavin-containing monooxygenase n=2 Tax=Macrostomum lignano TaxID=282301 RepID=A0A1I8GTI7_9PLAT